MANLSGSEIVAVATSAGLSGDTAAIAAAIALAESSGDPGSHNPVPPDNSYGLWQINMLAHTKKELGITSNDDLYNPATNAKAMMKISNGGTNWHPWTTYTSGKYKLYLGKTGGSATATSDQSSDTGFTGLANKIDDSNFWARIGEYLLGFVMIVLGLVLIALATRSGAVKSVIKTVTKAAAK